MIKQLAAMIIAFFIGASAPTAPLQKSTPKAVFVTTQVTKSIFVPSWAANQSLASSPYDAYYYFGLTPDTEGNIVHDSVYQHLATLQSVPANKRYVVLKLMDDRLIDAYLTSSIIQSKLIATLGRELTLRQIQGVVIDLELSFTMKPEREKQITTLVQQMCTGLHKDYKSCFVAIYGDTFYQTRPYNIQEIGAAADRILVMAYDFHKAGGEPGPNFPLSRRSMSEGGDFDYGYDFKHMVADFTSVVPKDKLEIIFGMYGYDWTMNEQKMPLKSAQALTLRQIESQMTNNKSTNQSQITNYKLQKNPALEKLITYIDSEGRRHVVWYEDEESVAVKIDYLRSQGIGHISYWAYGYF